MIHQLLAVLMLLTSAPLGPNGGGLPAPTSDSGCLRVCQQETSNVEMRECLTRQLAVAEKELQALVAAVRKKNSSRSSDRNILDAFEKSQTAWSAYHDAECEAVAENWAGGSGQRVALLFCLVEHTRQRSFEVWRNYHLEKLPKPRVLCGESSPDS